MPSEKRYFFGLDIVRFMAALIVATFHLGFWATLPGSTPNRTLKEAVDFSAISNFAWSGWVGVEVFFVISGFVIAGSAYMTPAWTFLRGRILRLYPAAWLCASITLAVLLVNDQGPLSLLLPRYLHSMSLSPYDNGWGWIDGVYWTLQYEIPFYALVLLTLPLRRFVSLPHIAYLFSVVGGLYIALSLARSSGLYTSELLGIVETHPYVALFLQLRYGCFFAVGIWLWVASTGELTKARTAALLVALLGAGGEVFTHANEFIANPHNAGRTPILPIIIFTAAVIIIAALTSAKSKLKISASTSKVLRTVGLMTYPFYLLHDIVGAWTIQKLLLAGFNEWVALVSGIVIIGLFSLIICRYIEPNMRRALAAIIPRSAEKRNRQPAHASL